MWIHDTNAPTRNLRVPGMPEDADPIDIPESDVVDEGGVLQVPAGTGLALTAHCPSISEHETPPEEDDVDDAVLDDDVTEADDDDDDGGVEEPLGQEAESDLVEDVSSDDGGDDDGVDQLTDET